MPGALNSLLALCIVLGLLHIVIATVLVAARRGPGWALGPRDDEAAPPSKVGGRAERAMRNFLETFPFFAAAVVCAIAIRHDGSLPVLGAQLYFWARLAYLPLYLLGVPVLRTLAWSVSIVGLLIVVFAIF